MWTQCLSSYACTVLYVYAASSTLRLRNALFFSFLFFSRVHWLTYLNSTPPCALLRVLYVDCTAPNVLYVHSAPHSRLNTVPLARASDAIYGNATVCCVLCSTEYRTVKTDRVCALVRRARKRMNYKAMKYRYSCTQHLRACTIRVLYTLYSSASAKWAEKWSTVVYIIQDCVHTGNHSIVAWVRACVRLCEQRRTDQPTAFSLITRWWTAENRERFSYTCTVL